MVHSLVRVISLQRGVSLRRIRNPITGRVSDTHRVAALSRENANRMQRNGGAARAKQSVIHFHRRAMPRAYTWIRVRGSDSEITYESRPSVSF